MFTRKRTPHLLQHILINLQKAGLLMKNHYDGYCVRLRGKLQCGNLTNRRYLMLSGPRAGIIVHQDPALVKYIPTGLGLASVGLMGEHLGGATPEEYHIQLNKLDDTIENYVTDHRYTLFFGRPCNTNSPVRIHKFESEKPQEYVYDFLQGHRIGTNVPEAILIEGWHEPLPFDPYNRVVPKEADVPRKYHEDVCKNLQALVVEQKEEIERLRKRLDNQG